jgi:hypothetical protein
MDLSAILSKPASEIKPPEPMPTGLYMAQVEKMGDPREVNTKNGPAPVIDLTIKVLQPLDVEVPPTVELPRSMRYTLWLGDNSLHMTRTFLESSLGIESGNKTLGEMLGEVNGRMFRAEVIEKAYTPSNGETRMINEIGKTFAVD